MSEENIKNITKLKTNFAPNFVNHHVLPGIKFNGQCLINNISIPAKVINLYIFLHTKSMNKKLKDRLYIKTFLLWICKAN